MAPSHHSPNHYDTVSATYDDSLNADSWTRGAFQCLVVKTVKAGGLLMDFGCGTGIDAKWYAAQGFQVFGCDNSEGMLTQFREKCADEIASGVVTCACLDDAALQSLELHPPVDAIACNFAVLSHIDDLTRLFDSFVGLLAPDGHVIVNVLNPLYWGDVKSRWWSGIGACLKSGRMRIKGNTCDTFRYMVKAVDRAASAHFEKVDQASVDAVLRRSSVRRDWHAPRTIGERLERRFWRSFAQRSSGRFVFLVYRRCL